MIIGIANLKMISPMKSANTEQAVIQRKGRTKSDAPWNNQSRVVLNNGETGLYLFKSFAIPERGVG